MAQIGPGLAQCDDIMQFEHALRQSRLIDDKIIQVLNEGTPTVSRRTGVDLAAKCLDIHKTVTEAREKRKSAIGNCIGIGESNLERIRSSEDSEKRNKIKKAQTTLRFLKNELSVEDVIQARTEKAYREKCRDHL